MKCCFNALITTAETQLCQDNTEYFFVTMAYIMEHLLCDIVVGSHQPQCPPTCWCSNPLVFSSHCYIITSVLSAGGQTKPSSNSALILISTTNRYKVSWLRLAWLKCCCIDKIHLQTYKNLAKWSRFYGSSCYSGCLQEHILPWQQRYIYTHRHIGENNTSHTVAAAKGMLKRPAIVLQS